MIILWLQRYNFFLYTLLYILPKDETELQKKRGKVEYNRGMHSRKMSVVMTIG